MTSAGQLVIFLDPVIFAEILLVSGALTLFRSNKMTGSRERRSLALHFGNYAITFSLIIFISDCISIFANSRVWDGDSNAGLAVSLVSLVYGLVLFLFSRVISSRILNETE